MPITVVAYLYLGLTYGGYPYLVRAMVPKRLRAIKMKPAKKPVKQYSAATKISFAVVMCVILCLLFPVAAPLFFSLFIGVVIKESGLKHVNDFISGPMLYGSTFSWESCWACCATRTRCSTPRCSNCSSWGFLPC